YLQQPSGEPTVDLLSMAHEELGTKLRSALLRAVREDQPATSTGIRVRRKGESSLVRVTVRPVSGTEVRGQKSEEASPSLSSDLLLVTFEDEVGPSPTPPPEAGPGDVDAVIRQLEYELKATREDLQSTIEEVETTNEELKTSNE